MSLFVCENCRAIENTALGQYWCTDLVSPPYKGKKLCSECSPTSYSDGSLNPDGGRWHGRFPKRIATRELINEHGRQNFCFTAGL